MTDTPETMITWSGTRHKVVGVEMRHGWFTAACSNGIEMNREQQPGATMGRPHKRDCLRCFPTAADVAAADFGSDTLADLERARSWAVRLEQQNAALIAFARAVAGNCHYPISGCAERAFKCVACRASAVLAACDGIPE